MPKLKLVSVLLSLLGTLTNSLTFSKFRIEEAEAQCALLNSESLCVSCNFLL